MPTAPGAATEPTLDTRSQARADPVNARHDPSADFDRKSATSGSTTAVVQSRILSSARSAKVYVDVPRRWPFDLTGSP
jgi:hypothetical protein